MLVPGILGFQALMFLLLMFLFLWLHNKWRNAADRKEEIKRLIKAVSKDSAGAVYEYNALPSTHLCAVCFFPTTTRCSRCKSVRYCSGKCQVIHWRQGHKDECEALTGRMHLKQGIDFCGRMTQKRISEVRDVGIQSLVNVCDYEEQGFRGTGKLERPSEEISPHFPDASTSSKVMHESKLPSPESTRTASSANGVRQAIELKKTRSSHMDERFDFNSQLLNGKMTKPSDAQPTNVSCKKFMRRAASSEMLVTDVLRFRSSPSSSSLRLDAFNYEEEDQSQISSGKEVGSFSFDGSSDQQQDACNGLKKSVWTNVQQFKALGQSHVDRIIFPYELFVKLYSCNVELYPFGLRNSGNSCYANAVLQCLAFTRPLTSYFLQRLHSSACRKKGWCFICEFEILILKAKEGESPLSPNRILSKIQNIGSHLSPGSEEDAHEFLRYAVDAIQSVCLKEAGALDPLAEETTLVGLTFGGYLRSKIKCLRCRAKSERYERMMDLTVEIDGNVGTLEEALAKFTANEILDGENQYNCSRCKSYVKAKKKLNVMEAPNILTVVLKRFQSSNLEKLNKPVRFPEFLDLSPYMSGKNDKYPRYSLYAVVVHKDTMSSSSSGHYVCYIKNLYGTWFGINDSTVIPVESKRVLLEGAYMLLYERHCPRGPALLSNSMAFQGVGLRKRKLESNTLNSKSNYHTPSKHPPKAHQKQGKCHCLMAVNDSNNNESHDLYDWRYYPVQGVPQVDSSSESSSVFSCSDASSCSTSTKGSVRSEDLSDFLFGGLEPGLYSNCGMGPNSVAPCICRNPNADDSQKRKDGWRQLHCSERERGY